MGDLKTVGIKELKNNLSAYLREVRRGTRVLVSDRSRVVAELHEPAAGYAIEPPADPRLTEWIESRTVLPPTVEKTKLPISPIRVQNDLADRLLDADRGETGS